MQLRALGGRVVLGLVVLATSWPTTSAQAASTDAMDLIRAMDRQPRVDISFVSDEDPDLVIEQAPCRENRLDGGGCERALHTTDASLMRFDTARHAKQYAGAADDRATALGRVVVSFGSPARVGERRRDDYVAAVATFRKENPDRRNGLQAIWRALKADGLPMRLAWIEVGPARAGLGADFAGVVDMASSKQVAVLVFRTREKARDYVADVSGGDDQVFRTGRFVLSYGDPALLGEARQDRYDAAFLRVLGR